MLYKLLISLTRTRLKVHSTSHWGKHGSITLNEFHTSTWTLKIVPFHTNLCPSHVPPPSSRKSKSTLFWIVPDYSTSINSYFPHPGLLYNAKKTFERRMNCLVSFNHISIFLSLVHIFIWFPLMARHIKPPHILRLHVLSHWSISGRSQWKYIWGGICCHWSHNRSRATSSKCKNGLSES